MVVAAGGPGSQAKFPADRGDALPLGLQLLYLQIALAGTHHASPVLGVGGGRLAGRLLRVGCLIRGGLFRGGVVVLDAAMVGGDGLHVVTQVIPHVPPVGDLLGTGRALTGAQRITPGSVSADQLDAGVCAEPVGEGAGLPVGQDAGDAVAVHVHQDAGVRLAAPLGPVVDPQHRDLPDLRIRHGPDQADQREPGDGRAQPRASRDPARGQCERDPLQQAPQPCRPPLVPGGQPLHLLSERRDRAGRVVADETADLESGLDGPPAAGQVLQAAPVPVVHPYHSVRSHGRPPARSAGYDLHAAAQVLHAIEVQPAQMREQQDSGFPAGELVQHNDSHGRSS